MPSISPKQRGTTSVEVAICLPILFLFLFGSYELSRGNFLSHAVESAAYEGARIGILPGANAEKIETAVDFVMRSCGAIDYEVVVTPATITADTRRVTVEVILPMEDNTNIPTRFLNNPVFAGSCTLTREIL